RRSDQLVLRHYVANRTVELALELQVAVRDDADELPRPVDDRHAGDLEPHHQLLRLAQRPVGSERDRVHDHARFTALHPIDLRGLPVDRHVLVNDPDAALARHRDRHFRFGHGVHGGGDDRDIERNGAREAAGDGDVAGMDRRMTGHQQDVVKGEGDVGSEGSHGGSYWAGLFSSTGFGGAAFLVASSTAALPAATTPSKNRPAFPTASIVPLMMVTGTRPARIVSSSVSATFWNAGAPAARCAYLDSRNSM